MHEIEPKFGHIEKAIMGNFQFQMGHAEFFTLLFAYAVRHGGEDGLRV